MRQDIDEDVEILTATLTRPLTAGKHTVTFVFEGVLNDVMAGFYRSQYTSASGERKYMASTQVSCLCVCDHVFVCCGAW